MTDEPQLALAVEANTPEPDQFEVLRDAAVTRLTAEVSKSTINAAGVETIRALVEIIHMANNKIRESKWDMASVPTQALKDMNRNADDLGSQEVEDAEIVAEAEKALKKAKKAKKKETK